MNQSVRQHLPIIVVVSLVGIATASLLLGQVRGNAAALSFQAFSTFIFLIPCVVMLVCSTVIVLTAHRIGRQLYLVVVSICLVTGLICMFITSGWLSDPSIAAQLLANSPEGTVVMPILREPIVMLRDIAAFFVFPTIGCIVGAWLGSRLHPMSSDTPPKQRKKRR